MTDLWVPLGESASSGFLVPDEPPILRVLSIRHPQYFVAPHWPYRREHLDRVAEEMARRGECYLRAVWVEGSQTYQGIEGSHRAFAATTLGLWVEIEEVGEDYTFQHDQPEVGLITARQMLERVQHLGALYIVREVVWVDDAETR